MMVESKPEMLNAQDEGYGNALIHIASGLHSFGCSRILIESGADLTLKNFQGHRPLDIVADELETYKKHMNTP